MTRIVFSRDNNWLPRVLEDEQRLLLEVAGGADANHDPRTFTVPVGEAHLPALRDSLPRHLLLYGALRPLCDAAGVRGPWDEAAAAALLDPILLGAPQDVDDALRGVRVDRRTLVAHNANVPLLNDRRFYEAAQSVTVTSDWSRVREDEAR